MRHVVLLFIFCKYAIIAPCIRFSAVSRCLLAHSALPRDSVRLVRYLGVHVFVCVKRARVFRSVVLWHNKLFLLAMPLVGRAAYLSLHCT